MVLSFCGFSEHVDFPGVFIWCPENWILLPELRFYWKLSGWNFIVKFSDHVNNCPPPPLSPCEEPLPARKAIIIKHYKMTNISDHVNYPPSPRACWGDCSHDPGPFNVFPSSIPNIDGATPRPWLFIGGGRPLAPYSLATALLYSYVHAWENITLKSPAKYHAKGMLNIMLHVHAKMSCAVEYSVRKEGTPNQFENTHNRSSMSHLINNCCQNRKH